MENFVVNIVFGNEARIKLATPLDLTGYNVTVISFTLPKSYYNIPTGIVEYRNDQELVKVSFPAGFYESNLDLVNNLNHVLDRNYVDVSYDGNRQIAAVHIRHKRSSLMLPKHLANIMNLPYAKLRSDSVSSRPFRVMGLDEPILLETNFTKPQMFNGTLRNILHTCPINRAVDVNSNVCVETRNQVFEMLTVNVLNINNMQPVMFIDGKSTLCLKFEKRA